VTTERGSTRRQVIAGGAAAAAFGMLGCSSDAPAGRAASEGNRAAAAAAPAQQRRVAMIVHRDPSCGCCENGAAIAQRAGYAVTLRSEPDMAGLKARMRVPAAVASCHTTVVDGLVVEGHVPLADVARLLRERPAGIVGIGVPGMPAGSPGMEVPDGRVDRFDVLAFDDRGRVRPYSA
jgi:hypothetical protein